MKRNEIYIESYVHGNQSASLLTYDEFLRMETIYAFSDGKYDFYWSTNSNTGKVELFALGSNEGVRT